MIYSNLIPHPNQWQRLVTAFRQERLAHAYLFFGPAGSGKEGHAIELAAIINCLQPDDNGFEGACGECPSCAKARTMQHPNIQLVVPLPRRNPINREDSPLKALKQGDLDDLTAQIASKMQDPYFKIRLEGAQSVLINSVRELRRTAYLKPGEPGWRVILVFEAEKLCYPQPAAANALLKLLEEPPDWTVFILVTDRPHLLLDTIRSRCLGLHFSQLATEDVAAYLQTHHELGEVDAGILAQATGGNLSLARQLAEEEESQMAAVDELIGNLLADQPTGWQKMVNDLALLRRRRSLEFAHRMQLLQLWLRDLMVLRKTGEHDRLVFKTRLAELKRFQEAWPEADWGNTAAIVETVLKDLERNINPTLVLTNMILEIRDAIGAGLDLKTA